MINDKKLSQQLFSILNRENLTALDKFNLAITQHELYSNDSKLVDELLYEMATRKIVAVGKFLVVSFRKYCSNDLPFYEANNWRKLLTHLLEEKRGGTQFKLKVRFDNNMYAIAKPMR